MVKSAVPGATQNNAVSDVALSVLSKDIQLKRTEMMRMRFAILLGLLCFSSAWAATASPEQSDGEWRSYGRDPGGMRYSPLTQVNRQNVTDLKVTWTFRTCELQHYKGNHAAEKAAFEATPIMVGDTLYLSTPSNRVFALDPASGAKKWEYNADVDLTKGYSELSSRGVSIWLSQGGKNSASQNSRIFMGTIDGRLICLDSTTGILCKDFGNHGVIDLKVGVGNEDEGQYQVTSPPAVIGNIVVVGSSIGDNRAVKEASGVVRAYDVHSGKLVWSWDPIPHKASESGYSTWNHGKANNSGAANAWSVISADPARDLVFIPTTAPSPDYYGGERIGSNLYANSVVALRASTGKMVWHFQTVHHDIWDYDVAMQPALVNIKLGAKSIPAVAFGTKMGHIFVLERGTGKPIFPVEERVVPQTDVAGEETSATQPFPSKLPCFGLRKLSADDAWGLDDQSREYARKWISSLRYDGVFTPISLKGTVEAPSNVGGMNWGGVAFDPKRALLIAPTNRLAAVVTLIPRNHSVANDQAGERLDVEYGQQRGTPYTLKRDYLLNKEKGLLPYTPPPWGTLAAVNLNTGNLSWEVPLGYMLNPAEHPDAEKWGSINLGGPITTAGGLVFIAATLDANLRAFDIDSGKLLWKELLPAGAQATPMTYFWQGKQYLVICAGGHGKLGTKLGDYVIAYALPAKP